MIRDSRFLISRRPYAVDLTSLRGGMETRHDGGHCDGRWDGKSYWGDVTLDEQAKHLAVLQPMLAAYPEIPVGYDGWWRF